MYYRKYRPQVFSEIEKTSEAVEALPKQIINNKTVHAYLFVGPRGTGKTTTARILAKALNCAHVKSTGDPCNKCSSCKDINQGSFTDLIEIDAASNRGIDDIRDLKDRVKLAPTSGKVKVYIVDEVHMLSTEAFNAFLKTLEEPPRNTVFILCTTEFHKVPDTIKSRCQVYKFKRASLDQLITRLKKISTQEDKEIDDKTLHKVALASVGGFRDAETLLQQILEGEVNVDSLVGSSGRDVLISFVNAVLSRDLKTCMEFVQSLSSEGADIYVWLGDLLNHLRDLLKVKSGIDISELELLNDFVKDFETQVKTVNFIWLSQALSEYSTAQKNTKSAFIQTLPLEIACINMCYGSESIVSTNAPIDGNPTHIGDKKIGQSILNDKIVSDKDSAAKPSHEKGTTVKGSSEKETKEKTKRAHISEDVSSTPDIKETTHEKAKLVESVPAESNHGKPTTKEVTAAGSATREALAEESTTEEPAIALETVQSKWQEVSQKLSKINSSLSALVKNAQPKEIHGKIIVMSVAFPFHKERLESARNRTQVEDILQEVLGCTLGIRCEVAPNSKSGKNGEVGNLTDLNIVPASVDSGTGNIIDIFDGGLPLIS